MHRKGPHEGEPLDVEGLKKAIQTLAGADPVLAGLHAHALRHTWNAVFSEARDQRATSGKRNNGDEEHEEARIREYQMGWESGSAQAARYNHRHIEKKAREAMVTLHPRK